MQVQCDSCGARYNLADTMAGKKVRCKKCGKVFSTLSLEDAISDEPDLNALVEPAPTSPRLTAVPTPRPPSSAPAFSPTVSDGFDDQPFEDESPPPSNAPVHVANRPFAFPGSRMTDTALPYILVLIAVGWMVVGTLQADNSGRPWLGHLRWFIYLVAYLIFAYPAALIGAAFAGHKLRFGMPTGHFLKILCIFSLPFMLGVILSTTGGTFANFIVGIAVGLVFSLGSFVFLYRLRQRQMGAGMMIVTGFYLGGVCLSVLVGLGLNVAIRSMLLGNHTAATFRQSPLGPAFSWDIPPEPPEVHKRSASVLPLEPEIASTLPATSPVTTQPGNTSVAVEIITTPMKPNVATTTGDVNPVPVAPATNPTSASTQSATVPSPTTELTTPKSAMPASNPAVTETSFVSSVLTTTPIGEFDEAVFPNFSGGSTALIIRARAPTEDNLELWSLQPFEKKTTFTLAHPQGDHTAYRLGPKGATMARIVSFLRVAIEIRSIADEKIIRSIEVNSTKFESPEIVGFAAANQIVVLGRVGGEPFVEMLDVTNGNLTRSIPLPQYQRGRGNLAISADGKYLAAAIKARVVIRGGIPARTTPGTPGVAAGEVLERPAIQVSDISGGRIPPRLYPIPSLGPDKSAIFPGLTFSPDSQRLSVLYEEAGNGLLVSWKLPETKPVLEAPLFGVVPANIDPDDLSPVLDELPGTLNWLAYGRVVIQSDHVIGDLGISNIKSHHFLDRDTLAIVVPADSGKLKLQLVKLNLEKLISKPVVRPAP